jgi:hypothetical protein
LHGTGFAGEVARGDHVNAGDRQQQHVRRGGQALGHLPLQLENLLRFVGAVFFQSGGNPDVPGGGWTVRVS